MPLSEIIEQEKTDIGVLVVDKSVECYKGLLVRKSGLSYVFVDPTASRHTRATILAEEFGHYKTSVGDTGI